MYNPVNWEDFPSQKTPITAANLRHMDEQIRTNSETIEKVKEELSYKITGTLKAGQTRLIFSSTIITGNGIYQVIPSKYGVEYNPINVVATAGRVVCDFMKLDEDVDLLLRFWEDK